MALSVFGNPYAPFDFNSGMGLEPIGLAEARSLGLMPTDADPSPEHAEMLTPQNRGLNERLEATPAVREQSLRNSLAERLQGFAQWVGDRLLFTDPNGTRPYTAEALADLWQTALPTRFADLPGKGHFQRESLSRWVRDHAAFKDKNERNIWEDLQRLHARLENKGTPPTLYRGMSMSEEAVAEFVRTLSEQGYSARTKFPVESWTNSLPAARNFARTGGKGWRVIVTIKDPPTQAFKDISPLVRAVKASIGKQSQPPVETESEWMLKIGPRFAGKVKRDQGTRTLTVALEGFQ